MRVKILNAMILATKLALISPVAHELVAQKFVVHGLMYMLVACGCWLVEHTFIEYLAG
jgi:hypothetical protein